jgi:hypothetical protein
MTFDEKALKLIEMWESGTYYGGAVQKRAVLQTLIVEALVSAAQTEREWAAKVAENRYKSAPLVDEETCYEVADAIRKGEGV